MRFIPAICWIAILAIAGCATWSGTAFGQEGGEPSEGEAVQEVPPGEVAVDLPVGSEGDLRFFVDTFEFRGPEGFTRQEVYTLIDARQLQFVPENGRSVGTMDLTVAVVDSAGSPVSKREWTRRVSVDSLDIVGEAIAPFRDMIGFDLKPGNYRVTVTIQDRAGEKQGACETVLEVRDFEKVGLVFSDILFSSKLERSGEKDRFTRHGWKVIPNTTRNYLSGKPLSVYFELYNFSLDAERVEDSFILGYSLVDSSGQKVREFPAKRILKPGESCVKAEFLETEGLPDGDYLLQVEAFDGGSRQYVRARRRVFVVSEEQPEELSQLQKDMLRYYADIRYIADEKTLKEYNALEDWPSKLKLLRKFWKSQDPTPETPTNERILEHMLRMNYADNRYVPGMGKRGSDTDRGRVYVKYGPPDDIDYHTSVAGQKPFEVWTYQKRGQYEFVFRDRRGNGLYILVHSTYPGELYNPYWYDEL